MAHLRKNSTITLREFDKINEAEKTEIANNCLDRRRFSQLENFILENKSGDDALELLRIRSSRAHRKIIQALNYVGLIQFKDGFTIEVLPKIYESDKTMEDCDIRKTAVQYVYMLQGLEIENKLLTMEGHNPEEIQQNLIEHITLFITGLKKG